MRRIVAVSFIVLIALTCLSTWRNFAEKKASNNIPDKLDGVYEFVSESTVLTKPRKTSQKRSKLEWGGVWQFHSGYYTQILMKRKRESFFNPQKLVDFGFESFSGTYKIEEGRVVLKQEYAFNPYNVGGTIQLKYRIEGDRLTLTQSLYPHVENLSEGETTTILHRLK